MTTENLPPPVDPADLDDAEEQIHARDLWAIARFFGPFAAPYRRPLLLLTAVLLIETLINACFPLATQYLIDKGLGGEGEDGWDFNVVIGFLVFLAAATIAVTGFGV